ncbi:MAG: amino acid ABC transporter ATP-binding protein [Acetobacteraceae bacterium]
MEPVLTVCALGKQFGAHVALNEVSLEVSKGEVIVLIGSSGSGKSTLLRCIAGLEAPDSGTIQIDANQRDRDLPRQKKPMPVGMVFQSFNLYPHINAERNVATALRHVQKLPVPEARRIAMAALESVGMGGFAHRYPGELSGGQQQRVAIARALALAPELMLFDEPTSALDPETVGDVLAVIKDIAERGMTMLIATHEMAFARDVGDRVVLLDHGQIREQARCDAFFAGPATDRGKEFLRRFKGAVNGVG